MSATELSLYTQVTLGRILWMAAYGLQLGLRRAWAYCYLAYESQARWRPVDRELSTHCTNSLLCERQGVRHRRACPGKTIKIEDYTRRILNV